MPADALIRTNTWRADTSASPWAAVLLIARHTPNACVARRARAAANPSSTREPTYRQACQYTTHLSPFSSSPRPRIKRPDESTSGGGRHRRSADRPSRAQHNVAAPQSKRRCPPYSHFTRYIHPPSSTPSDACASSPFYLTRTKPSAPQRPYLGETLAHIPSHPTPPHPHRIPTGAIPRQHLLPSIPRTRLGITSPKPM